MLGVNYCAVAQGKTEYSTKNYCHYIYMNGADLDSAMEKFGNLQSASISLAHTGKATWMQTKAFQSMYPLNVEPNGRMVGSSFRRNTRRNLHALLNPNRREPFDIPCRLCTFLLWVRNHYFLVDITIWYVQLLSLASSGNMVLCEPACSTRTCSAVATYKRSSDWRTAENTLTYWCAFWPSP